MSSSTDQKKLIELLLKIGDYTFDTIDDFREGVNILLTLDRTFDYPNSKDYIEMAIDTFNKKNSEIFFFVKFKSDGGVYMYCDEKWITHYIIVTPPQFEKCSGMNLVKHELYNVHYTHDTYVCECLAEYKKIENITV